MVLLGSGEDSMYNSTSTGSDVIVTSNCIYDITFLLSALLKMQLIVSEKIISLRVCSDLHFKQTRL